MNNKIFLYALCTLSIGYCSLSDADCCTPMKCEQIYKGNTDGRLKKCTDTSHIEPTKPSFCYSTQKVKQQKKKQANMNDIVQRQTSPLGRIMDDID